MGAMQNNGATRTSSKKSRGSVRNDDRLEAFSRANTSSGADWGACDPKWVQAVVVNITRLGGAVTFGMSRDMGAHSLTLMLDGTRKALWFNGDAELSEELETVAATLDAMQ